MPREKKKTLKRRPDGRYRCKYHDICFYGSSPEEAFALREAYKKGERQTIDTVSSYALPWLKRSYPSVRDSTYTGLTIHLQHLVDSIGHMRFPEVKPSDIKQVYTDHYSGLSNSYIRAAKQLYCALLILRLLTALQSQILPVTNPGSLIKERKPKKGY